MQISAVVPTLHRPELMKRCVQALLTDPALGELVICIDGPDKQSRYVADVLAESDSRVQCVQPGAHEGRMRARQNGLEASNGELVLLVDDDVIATSYLATNHMARHRLGHGRVVMGYMGVPNPTNVYERLYSREYEGTFERILQSDDVLTHLWGGNISVRRDDALNIGLVSEGFEDCYFEDRDFGLRCLAAGLAGTLAPEATADHHHLRNARRFVQEAIAMGRGLKLLHERHSDRLGAFDPQHFVNTAPPATRPLIRTLATMPDATCSALLGALSKPSGVGDGTARLMRRAKQHAGTKS